MPEADFLLTKIQDLFEDPQASKLHQVQALWSGYGEIARYRLPASQSFCITKHIKLLNTPHHPRAWNTDFSHQRKVSSYYNEQRFYEELATHCSAQCRVPKMEASGASSKDIWIIMEDLDAEGLDTRFSNANLAVAKKCVSWLANFHASFFAANISAVWPIGTYWFLDTRPEEWQKMQSSNLKDAAKLIDQRLNNAVYTTLLHGDAKLANFCFSSDVLHVAAVDFQYVGRGCGVKDLVYFLGSCFDNHQLYQYMPSMVNAYFIELKRVLSSSLSQCSLESLDEEWRGLIPFAWADFERFLVGWSPGHKKLNSYSQAQTEMALGLL
ncbi:phosphotransferase family protein [Glaciecola sp. SC05]|uniref:phosphotransferase family protein n=1 Tax=Glaciecola sp. SC05 TaxID=1987355 RepID=UPI003528AABD